MSKIVSILILLALTVISCEKENIAPISEVTSSSEASQIQSKSITSDTSGTSITAEGSIVDPNNDEDENTIGDTGIVDPNNDDDENTDALNSSNEN